MTFSFSRSDDVRHVIVDGVLRVTIVRPEKRNPLSLGVLDSLRTVFTAAAADPQIHVAVLTGAGDKAFASGGDLEELAQYRSREDAEAFSRHGKSALDAIRLFPVPVIARLNGLSLGGGAELALACDLRFAAASAKIGFIHGRLCISPSWGGGNDLVRLLGPAKALRIMATADIFDANTAVSLGLVDGVCPADRTFDDWFEEQLALFSRQPRQVLRTQKAIANAGQASGRLEADRCETRHFGEVWAHEDHWNAVAAFEQR